MNYLKKIVNRQITYLLFLFTTCTVTSASINIEKHLLLTKLPEDLQLCTFKQFSNQEKIDLLDALARAPTNTDNFYTILTLSNESVWSNPVLEHSDQLRKVLDTQQIISVRYAKLLATLGNYTYCIPIKAFNSKDELHLESHQITELTKLRTLEYFNATHTSIDDNILIALGKLPNLKSIGYTPLTSCSDETLEQFFSDVQSLDIFPIRTRKITKFLKNTLLNNNKIKKADFLYANFKNENNSFSLFTDSRHFESLDFTHSNINNRVLYSFKDNSNLSELCLTGCSSLTVNGIYNFLLSLTNNNLRVLDLSRLKLSDKLYKILRNQECIEELYLSDVENLSDNGLRKLLNSIPENTLKVLDLSGLQITHHSIQALYRQKNLEKIYFHNFRVADKESFNILSENLHKLTPINVDSTMQTFSCL